MKVLKQFKGALTSAAMIIGAIVICGGSLLWLIEPSKEERMKNMVEVDWDSVVDDDSEKLEISWMGIPVYPSAKDGGWIQKNLENKFNIKIIPKTLDANSYGRKRPLMLASGDVPDVMWDGSPLNVRNNVRNGFVMEVPHEVILKYAPNYVKQLNIAGKEAWMYSWHNGKNYGLPTFNDDASRPRISTWRKDWLEKVGIKRVPETIEEMGEALKRFRKNDPDGDGRKNTYGWTPEVGHWSLAYIEVFTAFNNLPFDFVKRDGKIVWGGVQPECKEALKVLRGWYANELIDPDYIVDTGGAVTTKFLNGKTGYVHPVDTYQSYDLTDSQSMASKLAILSPGGTLVAGPPLRNAEGKRVGRCWGGAAHVMQFGAHLARNPEKIIRVLKMIDAITVSKELYIETRSGKEGLHWKYTPDVGIKLLPPYAGNNVLMKNEMLGHNGFACTFYYPSVISLKYENQYLSKPVLNHKESYQKPEWAIMNPLGKSDVLPSASRYMKNLRMKQKQVYSKIISSELPLEYFDTFVKDWHRLGGDILTREANEMYATMNEIYKTVGATNDQ